MPSDDSLEKRADAAAAELTALGDSATMRDVFDSCVRHDLENLAQGMIELPPPRRLREIAADLLLAEDSADPVSLPRGETPLSGAHAVHQYRARYGEREFREGVAQFLREACGCAAVTADNVMATSGVSGAIVAALRSMQLALQQENSPRQLRVALLEPFYTYHVHQCRTATGVEPTYIAPAADLGPDFGNIAQALAGDNSPDVLIMCNPGNPQGNVWTEEQVREIVDLTARHSTTLLVDEIYCDLVFDNRATPFFSPAAFSDLPEHVIVCRGFSKSLGAQSWRTGFLVSAKARVDQVMRTHDPLFICVSWLQHALATYVQEESEDYFDHCLRSSDQLASNWRALAPLFESKFGWRALKPAGSMYGLFEYGDTAATDMEAVLLALKQGIGIAPGSIFFGNTPAKTGLVRIHLGFSTPKLKKLVAMLDGKPLFGEADVDSITYGKWNVRLPPQDSLVLQSQGGAKVVIDQNSKGFGELGSRVWDGSAVLAQFFDQCCQPDAVSPISIKGARALELGAGTGLAGITLARLGAAEVIMTDKESLVSLLEHNAARNDVAGFVRACELFWGAELEHDHTLLPLPLREAVARGGGGLDFVFGADLTYDFGDLPVLIATIAAVLSPFPKAVCLIAYGLERAATPEFLRQARERFGDVEVLPQDTIPQLSEHRRTHIIGIVALRAPKPVAQKL